MLKKEIRKNSKFIIFMLIIMGTFFINMGSTSFADSTTWTKDDIVSEEKEIDGKNYCYVSQYKGIGEVTIPAKITIGGEEYNTVIKTTTNYFFTNCDKITKVIIENEVKAECLKGMFNGCSSLTSLDLSNFDTSKVTNMSYMFNGCQGLTSLNVSGKFNTSKVTDMGYMFFSCISLTSLDLSNFDTSKVTTMGYMFNGCSKLTSLDVSGVKQEKLINQYSEDLSGVLNDLNNFSINNIQDTSKKGEKLEVTFNKSEGFDDSNFKYQWIHSNSKDEVGDVINDATDKSYIVQSEDTGKYIYCKVTIAEFSDTSNSKKITVSRSTNKCLVKSSYTPSSSYTPVRENPTYEVPQNLTAEVGSKLSDIKLPEGFSFVDPTLDVGNIGKNEFKLNYTPTDQEKYNKVYNITVYIEVTKHKNSFTEQLKIDNWTFEKDEKSPTAKAAYGEVKFLYSKEKDGFYTAEKPKYPGNYYLKAVVDESKTYEGIESEIVPFTIESNMSLKENGTNDFSFDRVKPTSSYVKGKVYPGLYVKIYNEDKEQIGKTVVADEDGNFSIKIPKQELYTKLKIVVSKEGYETYKKTTTVLKVFSKSLSVNSVKSTSKKVSGKGQPNAYVRVYNEDGEQIGKTAKVGENGRYSIKIPKQSKNTKLTIKMSKKATASLKKVITVK